MSADSTIRVGAASVDDAQTLATIWHLGWIDGHAATVSQDLVAVRTADDFRLAVVGGNDRAQAFYTKQGWQDEGVFDYEAAGPDGPINVPSHRFVKTLDRNDTNS